MSFHDSRIHYHVKRSLTPHRIQTFNRQFKEWGFPRRWKVTTAEDEARYLERIKQLWEQSYRSGEIAAIMHDEGFDISEQRISRLRRKHGLVLRGERDYAGPADQKRTNDSDLAGSTAPDSHHAQDMFNTVNDSSGLQQQHAGMMSIGDTPYQTGLAPHVAAPTASSATSRRRTQDMLDDDGEERPQPKRRRRLLRGMGPTPADAPGMPPRYKSETSLNECKAYLQLDNERYQTLREQYTDICNEMGITKKTKCEPGQWETSKNRLIRANLHLNAVMNIPHPSPHEVANALEVICADVTKKIRVTNTRISVTDANKGLQLNPAESKQIRHIFYQMLEQEGYTTMLEFGNERYQDIFQLWLAKSDILVRVQQQGMDAHKLKCLKILSRDAQKRLCDARLKEDPQKRLWVEGSYGPGPAAARPRLNRSAEPKEPKTPKRKRGQGGAPTTLDPSLAVFAPAPPVPSPIPLPVNAEFRLAPESRLVGYHPKVWTAQLEKCTVPGLHKAGTGKTGAARVGKLFGIVKTSDGGAQDGIEGIEAAAGGLDEGEDKYAIESDNDLVAYLHTAKELAGEKLMFLIELSGGYA